ncbi:hypothetical protein SJI00_05130 [Pseudomonas sp. RP23018S]|uniref:hypothetical protein n=1 Tax=Pseudomonas sp. RP23018S TaxID=3096037 RepID=UPI002ACA616D|nr:hypothetical protein [Pseudomonas sp. RP23018S]MDZ5602159.1 hypothetical protein [Pseudomonas sp. RP23018S]
MNSMTTENPLAVGIQSLDDFLKEMDKEPQTYEWDALLVFDRGAANTLLAQEYIDRTHDPVLFFPDLPDAVVDSGNGIEHVLLGLKLDRARLSFENANLRQPKGKLQMRLVGGKHLEVVETYLEGEPFRSIKALAVYNAATHAVLDMTVDLTAVQGTVDSSGKVLLDIAKAYEHQFSGGSTGPEKVRLGLYFKEVFDDWKDQNAELLQFPLSELVVDDGSPIDPGLFALGTHAEPGARLRDSKNFGDGAVVVFVAMKGNSAGKYPPSDSDLLYMLPRATQPYSSNLVLSHKFLMQQVLKLGFDQLDWLKGKFDLEELVGGRYQLVANADAFSGFDFSYSDVGNGGSHQPWRWKLSMTGGFAGLFSKGNKLVFEDRLLKAMWSSNTKVGTLVYWIQTGQSAGRTVSIQLTAEVSLSASYKFEVSPSAGQPIRFSVNNFTSHVKINIPDEFGAGDGAADAKANANKIIEPLKAALEAELKTQIETLENITFEIDALRLNKLLFRGDNVVEPRDVSWPTDLTLLGNLAPKYTSMTISPSEQMLASGQVLDFQVESAPGPVTWSVKNVPGETGDTGEFKDPSKGRYTAPADDALRQEGQRRLIVTATSGDMVSKALISVVPSHVSVNPWVAVVSLGKGYALSAATPDGSALTWDTPALGTVDFDSDPLNPGGYKYSAPVRLPKREAHEPHYYRALRLDPVTVRPTAGGAPATIDMLVAATKNANYWLAPEVRADGTIGLPFYRLNVDWEQEKVPEPIEWTVLRGSGTVDPVTQVYTPALDAQDQYVIISACQTTSGDPGTLDYVILPLPFVPVKRYANILDASTKEV